MAQEIERKFLVTKEFKHEAVSFTRISQGYLSSVPERIVRVRINGDKGYLTIKGVSGSSGISRFEWEKGIPVDDPRELLALCEPVIIDKTRYLIPAGEFTFEVDEFYGENKGLLMAEIELNSEDDIFEKPEWLGMEVTGDKRYYNSHLAKHPFMQWV